MSNPVEAYFTALRDIRASGAGVAEVSYYGALEALLNDVGGKLKPKVRAFMQLANRGAGNPDGGLFVATQFKHAHDAAPLQGQPPARGAIEVKGTSDDAFTIAASEQVARYVEHYGLVLVTNLRDFVLVGRGPGGVPRTLESCRLANTEAVFWSKVAQPRKYAEETAEGLTEFLKRVMLQNAPIADPKHVAWFLASYARTARLRLEHRDLPALDQLRTQLEEALGLKFEGDKGDHFFRSTLVQTLFYGMFASWVLWTREQASTNAGAQGRFEWETASATLHVPMVSELFYQFSNPAKLGPLGIAEVLEWAEEVLNRVDRAEFFSRFQEEHAVQYFYEPFLEAFDPQLRKELGVWYTPDEVVKYMVARVDWALREELGIPDGLADESVYVLDPCCGTGAYLVEVLRKIDATLQAKGADALTRQDVKRAAMERVIGFEIMPAPFVVAHLQLGLLLSELGVPLSTNAGEHERAAIYLTNALTGWKTDAEEVVSGKPHPKAHPAQLLFEFAEERDAAARVKQKAPILVVLGNPPYNGFAGVAQAEEAELIESYKRGLASEWGITKNYLDDLYVRFFRLAETVVERSNRGGVACFISNFSWLSAPSSVVMRRSMLSNLDELWIDNLNGDSRETGKLTPEGRPDPSVFSTSHSREGIQVGTAVTLMVRARSSDTEEAAVHYREFWGAQKLGDLANGTDGRGYSSLTPTRDSLYSLRPRVVDEHYYGWPSVEDLGQERWSLGLNENRAESLIAVDREAIVARMEQYFDVRVPLDALREDVAGLGRTWARFDPEETRRRLVAAGGFDEGQIRPFISKPFDVRWAYVEPTAKLWNEGRRALVERTGPGTRFLFARRRAPRALDGTAFYVATALADQHALFTDAYLLPLSAGGWAGRDDELRLDINSGEPVSKTRKGLVGYLEAVSGLAESDVWMHVLAVGYSPDYLSENADGLRGGWPRVPLPRDTRALAASALLGSAVAGLLDPMTTTASGAVGRISAVGVLASPSGSPLDTQRDLAVTARWGIAGKGGICMPSTGKLEEREYSSEEREAIAEGAKDLGMPAEQAISFLGERCFDVYLNDVAYWRCVPANVWRYTIGGYQVIKKWLSYREKALLGRDLTRDEARYVGEMVRRVASLVLMQPELDANYERVKADVWEWGA